MTVEANATFGLKDYLALHAWLWRKQFFRTLIIFFVFSFGVFFVISFSNGMTTTQATRDFAVNWESYLPIVAFALLITFGLSFIGVFYCWFSGRLPKPAKFTIDDNGVRLSTSDHETILQWSSVRSNDETEIAFYLRSKTLVLRMPKRIFSNQQLAAIRKIIAQNSQNREGK